MIHDTYLGLRNLKNKHIFRHHWRCSSVTGYMVFWSIAFTCDTCVACLCLQGLIFAVVLKQVFLYFYSLPQCLEWKISPPATPPQLNLNHLPLLLLNHPRAQPPQKTPLLHHPLPFPHHPTPSTPLPHHKLLTIPTTVWHTHLETPTRCKSTIIHREGLTMGKTSRLRMPIRHLRIIPSSNNSLLSMQLDWAEEKPTRTKTRSKDSNSGTAWNVRFILLLGSLYS